jgi:Ca2+-binding RTX toxin-like protein
MFGNGLTGNGNSGANTLFGDGTFATTLNGQNGDDYIVGGAAGDSLHGGNDSDTIYGQAGADTITGDTGNDFIHGDAGNDTLNGGAGNDTIYGGLDRDTLVGGAGLDTFVFDTAASSSNTDRIVDFAVADDHIAFDHTVFAALQTAPSSSTLAASNFHIGAGATTADEHVIYDSAAGKLYYDADGSGAGAQQLVATLTAGLALTNAHFLVF